MSWPAASARSAPTVASVLGRWAKGSYWKKRMAFSWVIWLTSSSGMPCSDLPSSSGEVGQVESECG